MSVWSRNTLVCLVVVALVLAITPVSVFTAAEETRPSVEPDLDGQVRDCGKLLWSIVDVLEQQQISSPSRTELLAPIHQVLTGRKSSEDDGTFEKLQSSQTVDEFADAFLTSWKSSPWNQKSIPPFRDKVLEQLSQQVHDDIGLIHAKDYAVEEQLRNNRYVGLGVTLAVNEAGYATFPQILPGGAAERGGLKNEVIIMAVDGRSTAGIQLPEVLGWLRGPKGSQVTLTLAPQGKSPVRDVTLTRGLVRLDSVFGRQRSPLSHNDFREDATDVVGYLQIANITGSTLHELRDAEIRLQSLNVRALVLDFRSGGQGDNFHQARLLADALLDGGTIWTRHERNQEPCVEIADRECLFRNMPLVIAMDITAGPAHVAIAAALQDAGRAVIVGSGTNYDGRVPTATTLPDEAHVLRFSSAKLIRSRRDHEWPLKPDKLIEPPPTPPQFRPGAQVLRKQEEPATASALALANVARVDESEVARWNAIKKHQLDVIAIAKTTAAELLNQ